VRRSEGWSEAIACCRAKNRRTCTKLTASPPLPSPRLLGDGDFVFFLKDGAKFEVRNVPQYEDARKFILEQCDEDVRNEYNKKGEVN
jgi:hypothetical protein